VVLHLPQGHVEDVLVSLLNPGVFLSIRPGVKDPVGVGGVDLAVGVDVFGLDPETKLHGLATFVLETSDSPDEGVEPAFELLLVDYPVSQTRRVSVAGVLVPEPAIVENSLRSNAIRAVSTYEFLRLTHQAAPNLICLPGDVVDLLLVKVEICRLLVVDQHRSIPVRPL
jgi:hypothetical protein